MLGDEKNVITYLDDIVHHSSKFDYYVATLDSALHKFISAGFTINCNNCKFWRSEI